MVYYFSATGNSEWAANRLAGKTNDTAVSIAEMVKSNKMPAPISENEVLGTVFPVYAWSEKIRWLDKLVDEWAKGKPMEKVLRS